MNTYIQIFVLVLMVGISGCNTETVEKTDDPVIAQTMGKKLFLSEFIKENPTITKMKDSTLIANTFIDKWIKKQLLVAEAESKLSKDEMNVSQEIDRYRQELIIHKYKNKIMDEVINTPVPEDKIIDYYKINSDKYILTRPVVRVAYIIFPSDLTIPASIRNILHSNKPLDIDKYEEFIFKYAKKYDDFENKWLYFDNISKTLQFNISDPIRFLRTEKYFEKEFGDETHLIVVRQYHLPGEQAPIELVEPQIRGAIINRNKMELLRNINDSLYNEALKSNKFQIFNLNN